MSLRGTLPRGIGRDLFGQRGPIKGAPSGTGKATDKATRTIATRPSGGAGEPKGTRGQ